ncbi:DUF1700 domain-containing protein [Mycoplasmatota bacterium]|nr:DUF1700 domain-containing protein [Mycoplasmatota bacterium]
MRRQEFIDKLKSLLEIDDADKTSLIEEYESYFDEAMADGATEEEVIAMLETPKEIAMTANEEFGTKSNSKVFREFIDEQVGAVRKGYEKVIESGKTQEVSNKINSVISNTLETVKESLKQVRKSIKESDINEKINEAVGKVQESLGKVKDINIINSFDSFVMKYDNSRIESFDIQEESLEVKVHDSNSVKLNIEVTGHENDGIIIKSLPTTMKYDVSFEGGILKINVIESNIRYSESKRMLILLPECIKNLKFETDCPIVLKCLNLSEISVSEGNSPLVIKDINYSSNVSNTEDDVKEISLGDITVKCGSGPVVIKNIKANKLDISTENGPNTIKTLDAEVVKLQLGNGPVTIKDITGGAHLYKIGSGPKTIKEISLDSLELQSDGGILSMKDVMVTKLLGDIKGTMKTLKNVSADSFEINK